MKRLSRIILWHVTMYGKLISYKRPVRVKALGKRTVFAVVALCLMLGIGMTSAVAEEYQPSDLIQTITQAPKSLLYSYPGSGECALGNVVADAVLASTGADIALINSGDLDSDLSQGDVYWSDVQAVFTEDRQLAVVEMTPAELKEILEQSVSHVTVNQESEQIDRTASDYAGFVQISGFSFQYDASAPVGARMMSVRLSDEDALDLEDNQTLILVAATVYMLEGGYGYEPRTDAQKLSYGLAEALAEHLKSNSSLQDDGSDRITVIGTNDGAIVSSFSPGLIAAACVMLMVIAFFTRKKLQRED